MNKICGFKFTSKKAFMATIEATEQPPRLVSKEELPFPSGQRPDEFVEWAMTELRLVLDREQPNVVPYKLTRGLDKHEQIFHIYYGLATLNLACQERGIKIKHVTPGSLKPTVFGLQKGSDVDEHIKRLFEPQKSPWNSSIREAIAVGLRGS